MDSGVYVDMGRSEKIDCRAFSKAGITEFLSVRPK
jgi:hypothetical protein